MNMNHIERSSISQPIDMNGDIRFDRIDFAYPARNNVSVLNDVTFVARAGETTAIVGSNGSGKH